MQRTVRVLGVVALALASCKKPGGNIGRVMKAFQRFTTAMCACKDKACADDVQDAMSKWSSEMAANADEYRYKPDEAALKAMTDLGQKYAECMTVAMSPQVPAEPAKSPEPTHPTPSKLSAPVDHPTIATLVQEAKEYARASEQHLVMSVLTARFVASDGMLDPTYGELTIGFGTTPLTVAGPVDDPVRPTGAPLPAVLEESSDKDPLAKGTKVSTCPKGVWSSRTGWTWQALMCWEERELAPRCSTAEVWKRAKANRAPANAVAVLNLRKFDNGTQSWQFSISDELRKVDIRLLIKDDCAAIVEKP